MDLVKRKNPGDISLNKILIKSKMALEDSCRKFLNAKASNDTMIIYDTYAGYSGTDPL